MEAFELYNKKGEPCGVWCCGKCRKLVLNPHWHEPHQHKSTREAAEKCCQPQLCECGKPSAVQYGESECSDCRHARWSRERAERLEKTLAAAEDVTSTYDGPLYVEGMTGDWGEGYFSNREAVFDYLTDDELDEESGGDELWAFACTSEVRGIDVDRALEQVCEDGYDDMGSDIVVPQYLKDAVDQFNKENASRLTVWNWDSRRKILIRSAKVQS